MLCRKLPEREPSVSRYRKAQRVCGPSARRTRSLSLLTVPNRALSLLLPWAAIAALAGWLWAFEDAPWISTTFWQKPVALVWAGASACCYFGLLLFWKLVRERGPH
jgi:hypothetical protein